MNVIANCTTISEPTAQDQDALGTGWMDVLLTAFNRMIAEGIIEPADDEEPDPWAAHMSSWSQTATEYHRDRAGHITIVEIEPKRLKWLRDLMEPNVSIDRAWTEVQKGGSEAPTAAPPSAVETLMFALRRGAISLTRPETVRRLSLLDPDQLKTVCLRAQAFQPGIAEPWSTNEVDALISAWRRSR